MAKRKLASAKELARFNFSVDHDQDGIWTDFVVPGHAMAVDRIGMRLGLDRKISEVVAEIAESIYRHEIEN